VEGFNNGKASAPFVSEFLPKQRAHLHSVISVARTA
jgi:hypothetical protein